MLAVAAFIAAAALDHNKRNYGIYRRKMDMKTNYNPENNERIEGKSVQSVLSAARVRFGGNYLVLNTQAYNNPHWIAEYNGPTKGNAGIQEDTRGISTGTANFI
ncbi:hypothetical protein [Bacillus mycoides]|uniref:hypothetical protein n=1 Tax=Bacillus mycoides TaxID=1405 RepID=UPI003D649B4D